MKNVLYLFLGIILFVSCGNDNEKTNSTSGKFSKDSPVKGEQYDLTIVGATIPEKLSLDDVSLKLNGAGVRNKFMLKVYVAALYVTEKNSNPLEIINENKPQAIRIHIISDLMTRENMTEYIIEGFKRSTKGNTEPIQKFIDMSVEIFNEEEVHKGDIYDIFYLPKKKGIEGYKNGKFLRTIEGGLEVKKALFGIWLSDDPVDEDLKDGLLGLKPTL